MHTVFHSFVRACRAGWLAVLLLLATGCSRGVNVEGEVTFDGQPVESGSIVFEPADGQGPSFGGSIESGRYAVSGQSAGSMIVRIRAVRKTGRQVESGPPDPPGTMVDEVEAYIPAVYNSQSTLTREVAPRGTTRHDFQLTPP